MMQTDQTQPQNKKRSYKALKIIALCTVVIATAIIYFTFKWEITVRFQNLVNNHYSYNDKLYLTEKTMNPKFTVGLYRLIESTSPCSTEKPHITDYMIGLSPTRLAKLRSSYAGNFLGHRILHVKVGDKMVFTNFYAIKPFPPATYEEPEYLSRPPQGYRYKDSMIYVFAEDVTDHETIK